MRSEDESISKAPFVLGYVVLNIFGLAVVVYVLMQGRPFNPVEMTGVVLCSTIAFVSLAFPFVFDSLNLLREHQNDLREVADEQFQYLRQALDRLHELQRAQNEIDERTARHAAALGEVAGGLQAVVPQVREVAPELRGVIAGLEAVIGGEIKALLPEVKALIPDLETRIAAAAARVEEVAEGLQKTRDDKAAEALGKLAERTAAGFEQAAANFVQAAAAREKAQARVDALAEQLKARPVFDPATLHEGPLALAVAELKADLAALAERVGTIGGQIEAVANELREWSEGTGEGEVGETFYGEGEGGEEGDGPAWAADGPDPAEVDAADQADLWDEELQPDEAPDGGDGKVAATGGDAGDNAGFSALADADEGGATGSEEGEKGEGAPPADDGAADARAPGPNGETPPANDGEEEGSPPHEEGAVSTSTERWEGDGESDEDEDELAPADLRPGEGERGEDAEQPAAPAHPHPLAGTVVREPGNPGEIVLDARMHVGIGNVPFVRGDGPGLSWDRGVEMKFIEIGRWQWKAVGADAPARCRVYFNDEVPAEGDELELAPGERVEIHPEFRAEE